VVTQGIEHGIGVLRRKEAVHNLILAKISDLGHHRFVAFNPVGNAVDEVQLVIVTDLGAVEVVEAVDDLGQSLLLGVLGFVRKLPR